MIVDATGAIVAEAGNDKEELLVAEIDLDKVRGDRKKVTVVARPPHRFV